MMNGHMIEIDYHNQLIKFYNKNDKEINYKGYTKLKMYTDIYPTSIKSTLIFKGEKYKGLFGLDTGADDALTIAAPFAKSNSFVDKMTKIGTAHGQGSDGSEYEMPIVLCPEVEFAEK